MLYKLFEFSHSTFIIAVSMVSILFAIILLLSVLLSKKQRKNELKDFSVSLFAGHKISWSIFFVFLIFVGVFGNKSFVHLLGENDIRTMHEGIYCYYVIAESESGKEYTLPAKIEVEYYDTNSPYTVRNVYFPNGGYLYIEDTESTGYNEKVYAFDQNGREWSLTVTNQKAEHEKVKNSSLIRTGDLLFCTFKIIIVLLTWILCLYYAKKESTE